MDMPGSTVCDSGVDYRCPTLRPSTACPEIGLPGQTIKTERRLLLLLLQLPGDSTAIADLNCLSSVIFLHHATLP